MSQLTDTSPATRTADDAYTPSPFDPVNPPSADLPVEPFVKTPPAWNDYKTLTKRQSMRDATQMGDRLYSTARELFDQIAHEGPFRLIGVGLSDLVTDENADLTGDLLDPGANKRAKAERATDQIKAKFGKDAILKGRSLR